MAHTRALRTQILTALGATSLLIACGGSSSGGNNGAGGDAQGGQAGTAGTAGPGADGGTAGVGSTGGVGGTAGVGGGIGGQGFGGDCGGEDEIDQCLSYADVCSQLQSYYTNLGATGDQGTGCDWDGPSFGGGTGGVGGGTGGSGGFGTGGGGGGTGGFGGFGTGGAGGFGTGGTGMGGAGLNACPSADKLYSLIDVIDGPTDTGTACCYRTKVYYPCGRPFLVGDAIRTAPTVERSDWRSRTKTVEPDAAIAHYWVRDAQMEHASVAAFARLTLQLLQHGAPPDLIADSQAASIDEVKHARDCFALASAYAGHDLGPDALPSGDVELDVSLEELARLTFEEGCIGETVASMLARAQLELCEFAEPSRVLAQIVEDEARHSVFAWRVVRWAIEVGGDTVRQTIAETAARKLAEIDDAPASTSDFRRRQHFNPHGRLTPNQALDIERQAMREVIAPCLAPLLATEPSSDASGMRASA